MNKLLASLFLLFLFSCQKNPDRAKFWLTDPLNDVLFTEQTELTSVEKSALPQIEIDSENSYQAMDGFGFTLSQGSAMHLLGMDEEIRKKLLEELFGNEGASIGISYLRISVAASDLNEYPFSYDDLPDSISTDLELDYFDLGPDKSDVIPVLQEILKINPDLKIMASPWSPPAWMKDNKDTRGGSLLPEFEEVYAQYLAKYIKEMESLGIKIDALTVQNEPLHPGNNPSLLMLPEQQAYFIKNYLGPIFQEQNIDTKIIIYDHNADKPDYPISILNDSLAATFIDGSAFHLYGGKIDALSEVHQAHPDKNLYFTEQWIGAPGNLAGDLAWHVENLIIGASRNWAKTVLEWNLSSNPSLTPYTDRGGCNRCLGAVTIDGDSVTKNPAYFIIAHASKFVIPGSLRIDSTIPEGLPNVAFSRPDGKLVLIVLNTLEESQSFQFSNKNVTFETKLEKGSVGTYVW